MSNAIKLTITEGKLAGKEFIFDQPGSYLVGRSPSCAIQIHKKDDEKISRKHFVLTFSSKGVKIRDLDSRNGTLVNDDYIATGILFPEPDKIKPFDKELHDGDKITIGKTVILLQLIGKEEEKKVEAPPPAEIPDETIPLAKEAAEVKSDIMSFSIKDDVTPKEVEEEKAPIPPEPPVPAAEPPRVIPAKAGEKAASSAATISQEPAPAPEAPKPPEEAPRVVQAKPGMKAPASAPTISQPPPPPKKEEPVAEQKEEVSMVEETVVLDKPKAEPPQVKNTLEQLKEQFKPPQPKAPKKPKAPPKKDQVNQKEETTVVDSPKPVPPPLTATAKKTETTALPADALAKQAPPQPAGMQAKPFAGKKESSTDLKVKKPEETKNNLEEIARGNVEPPLSPDALGTKKTSSNLKIKSPGSGVKDTPKAPPAEDLSKIGSVKEELGLSDLETVQVDRDDVLDDIDLESMVQKSKLEQGKRTTKFKVKGPK